MPTMAAISSESHLSLLQSELKTKENSFDLL